MKQVNLTCSKCGAELTIDPEKNQAFCPYCGSRLLLEADETISITRRVIDEARLKEAEVRLKELEYQRERELRQEEREAKELLLYKRQRLVRILSFAVYIAACLATLNLEGIFPFVLLLGGAALYITRPQRKADLNRDLRQYSVKSRPAALLLCVFFGIFGAHYFYTRRIGMGILYLLTLGFFGIGWFIDIIRLALGTFRDKDGMYLKV